MKKGTKRDHLGHYEANCHTFQRITQVIARMKDPAEVDQFLRAFYTPAELETLCERFDLVELLMQGVPQREISKRLGVSLSKITRGSHELKFGVGREVFPKVFPPKKS